MDFAPSARSLHWLARLQAFSDRYLLPHTAAWHRHAGEGRAPPFLEDPKTLAREEGLWNLCLPHLAATDSGTCLFNLDYAPLAEHMGACTGSAEVFNCNAPDSGNMALARAGQGRGSLMERMYFTRAHSLHRDPMSTSMERVWRGAGWGWLMERSKGGAWRARQAGDIRSMSRPHPAPGRVTPAH